MTEITCPKCGSDKVRKTGNGHGVNSSKTMYAYKCVGCGEEFHLDDPVS